MGVDDDAVIQWRQGDCVVDSGQQVVYRASMQGSDAGAGHRDFGYAEQSVAGFVVITQTCDVVRPPVKRPYVQVAPLRSVNDVELRQVELGRRPSMLFIPGVAGQRLVGELDLAMTVEKAELASWERTAGWTTDLQERRIRKALGRNVSRPAFPDDFTERLRKMRDRAVSRHSKHSAEGAALRSISEIRVRAAPNWNAPRVELTFLFIAEGDVPDSDWEGLGQYVTKLAGRFEHGDRFAEPVIHLVTLDDITARDYSESDQLDLEFLSEA